MSDDRVLLLDEELAVLLEHDLPFPWLDRLEPAALDRVLESAARGLLLRGLAVVRGGELAPSADLQPLLPRAGVPLLAVLPVSGDHLVARTVQDGFYGDLLVHDARPDGTHALALAPEAEVRELVEEALCSDLGPVPEVTASHRLVAADALTAELDAAAALPVATVVVGGTAGGAVPRVLGLAQAGDGALVVTQPVDDQQVRVTRCGEDHLAVLAARLVAGLRALAAAL